MHPYHHQKHLRQEPVEAAVGWEPQEELGTEDRKPRWKELLGNVACIFKKNPTLTQDLSRRCIAMRGGECVYVPS
jgi:hypothetical protein